jgi:hypothetical protein
MRIAMLALWVGATASVLSGPVMAQGHGRYRDALLVCESQDGRPRQCAADIRGDVRLVRQLSRSECVEGRTWGVIRGGIWVSDGCRGEFLVAGWPRDARSAPVSRFLRCESIEGRSNHCPANTRRGVVLVRQLSRDPCIRNQSWGWNERGVWVSAGCRAEFRTAATRRDDAGEAPATVRCESIDGAPRHCPADTRGGVRVVRQRSRAPCIEGRSWSYDRDGIRVESGCRADFAIGGTDRSDRAPRDR